MFVVVMSVMVAVDLAAVLEDRIHSYDVYYDLTLLIKNRSERSEGPPIHIRPLRPSEAPAIRKHSYRCRKAHGVIRQEEFRNGRLIATVILADGVVHAHLPELNEFSLTPKSGEYAQPHHAYDNFRFLMFRTTTLFDLVKYRRNAGCPIEFDPGGILRIGPGDGSSRSFPSGASSPSSLLLTDLLCDC